MTEDKDFNTADKGFAAYLMTRYTCLGAFDTGRPLGGGRMGTQKEFNFLVPADADMAQELTDYQSGAEVTKVPAVVMFNKMRLVNDFIQRPVDLKAVA